jgi:outer membrane protein TolC
LITLLLLLPQIASAEALSLKEALLRAEKQNQELVAQRLQIKQAEQDIRRVGGEFGPHLEALAGIGPITKATGNATNAVEDKSSFGRMLLGKLSLTMPLYTWGRKDNYGNAAKAGVQVKEAEALQKTEDVRFQVKEAYHGFQLANSLKDFIEGGKAELEKALAKKPAKKKETKDDYKLEIFLSEVQSREAEVKKYFELAKEGLALRVGMERGTIETKDAWLIPEKRQKREIDYYVSLARGGRAEFKQLAEGIFAKRSLAKAEKKALWPALVFLASYELGDTNVRTHQPGVFAYDPYNKEIWTLGVGFKLDFQWGLAESKSDKLRAEAEELEAKEVFAKQGIETEVRKAYLELEEAEVRLEAAKAAYATGKKWLTGEVIGYSSGLAGAQGLVEAYGARAETTKTYFEAVYRHHMAWAALSKAVGQEVDPILLQ